MLAELLIGAALYLLGAGFWIWLCIGALGSDRRRLIGLIAVQISALCLVYGAIRGAVFGGVLGAAFAPAAVYFSILDIIEFHTFAAMVAVWVAPFTLLVFAGCLALPRLRVWSLAVSILCGFAATMFVGEWVSKAAMCHAAIAAGIPEFRRNSFGWSLRNAPAEFQFEIHAVAISGKKRFGWSYGDMAWYEVSLDTTADVNAAPTDCPR